MTYKIRITVVAAVLVCAMCAWAVDAWPAALAPAYREFASKCEAGTATRGDLIALKRFIAASAVDGAEKTNLTRQARMIYQRSKVKRSEVKGQR